MTEFKSCESFLHFAMEVKLDYRYFTSAESCEFLDTVLATSGSRTYCMPTQRALWRAQLGHDWKWIGNEMGAEFPRPFQAARMKPLRDRATEGRVNPRNIPYLYTASDPNTAIAEIRPWVGALVSVAQFATVRNLHLITCASDQRDGYAWYWDEPEPFRFVEPSPVIRERAVWEEINIAFSLPVGPEDDNADYVPTQILAEFFKMKGFDGIIYRSALGSGYNCCLFDVEAANFLSCHLYKVNGVEYNASEVEIP